MKLRAFHLPKSLKCKLGEERELQAGLPGPSLAEAALTSICSPRLHVYQVRLLIQSGHRPGEGRETEAQWPQDHGQQRVALRVITGLESQEGLSCAMQIHSIWPVMVTMHESWSGVRELATVTNHERIHMKESTAMLVQSPSLPLLRRLTPSKRFSLPLGLPSILPHLITSTTSSSSAIPLRVCYSLPSSVPQGRCISLSPGCLLQGTLALLSWSIYPSCLVPCKQTFGDKHSKSGLTRIKFSWRSE